MTENQPAASLAIQVLTKTANGEEGAESVSTYMKWGYAPRAGVWSIQKKTAKHHANAN
jgi:hypothetical protein